MDVMTAFLKSVLCEEIYLKKPEGFFNHNHTDRVWPAKYLFYGLKQAPREWNKLFTDNIVALGLCQSKHDPVLFPYVPQDKVSGAVVVHVADNIFTGIPSFFRKNWLSYSGALQDVQVWSSRNIPVT